MTADDVRVAAELALPHRRRRDPFDEPGLDQQQLDDAMEQADADARAHEEPEPDPDGPGGGTPPADDAPEAPETSESAGFEKDSPSRGAGSERAVGAPGPQIRARMLEIPGVGDGAPGRRSRSRSTRGRVVRSMPERGHGLHLVSTLFAAAEQQAARGRKGGPILLAPSDIRGALREGREGNLVVFVVDASGSMAARDRLSAVTGAVVSLLRDAYQRRDKVAVITVRGTGADVVLPPTSSVDIAVRRLRSMRTGGRTPLAEGFLRAREVVVRERVRDPRRRALVVVLTDGRATGSKDAVQRAARSARMLTDTDAASIVVDCETGMVRLGLAAELARHLSGGYVRLAELSAQQVAGVVRAAA